MNAMKPHKGWLLPVLATAAVACPMAIFAQESDLEQDALDKLQASTNYLAAMTKFKFTANTAIEIVINTGQKLQLDHKVEVSVQRPDKLLARRVGELVSQTFHYDGATLTMFLPDMGYYASAAAPATIDDMLTFARDDLGIIAPGADFIYSNAWERLTTGLTSAFIVGDSMVNGVKCDHLAFRNDQVDWQLWIEQGEKPLPRKFVITSKLMPQSPGFSTYLSDWEEVPVFGEADFEFKPPKKATRIEFITASASTP